MKKPKTDRLRSEVVKASEALLAVNSAESPLAALLYASSVMANHLQQMSHILDEGLTEEDVRTRNTKIIDAKRSRLSPDQFEAWLSVMGPRMEQRALRARARRSVGE